jgi:hypothetical protein
VVALLGLACLSVVPDVDAQAAPPAPQPCQIAGRATASSIPLPGVALTVSLPGGGDVAASSTGVDGRYLVPLPAAGTYVLHASLAGFADVMREVTLAGNTCEATVGLDLVLRSRAPAASVTTATEAPASSPSAHPEARPAADASKGRRPGTPGGRFRDLGVVPGSATWAEREAGGEGPDAESESLLPSGFSPDAPTESVATAGNQVQTVDALLFRDRQALLDEVGGDLDALAQRMRQGGSAGGMGPAGGFGPPGRPGGGEGGFGPGRGYGGGGYRGGPGGWARGSRLQGSVFYSLGGSALDASPYPLNGPQQKANYLQQRFGATLGGPLKIPGVYDGTSRTSFFFSYMGNHSNSPHDAYSTVPTAPERSGDLSGLGRTIVDPATGRPFPGGVIPASRIDPSAQALLAFIPLPNLPGATQNFHYLTAAANSSDQFTLRFTHGFGGAQSEGLERGRGGMGGRGMGGPGGGMGRRPTLTVGLTYRTSSSSDTTAFPTLGGTTHGSAWDVPVTFSFTKGRVFSQLRADFNRVRSDSLNLYAYSRDVAAEAGIDGIASDPFDWGVPNLSFTTFASLRDPVPSSHLDQRISLMDTQTATWGKHTVRWGGAYAGLRRESQTDPNARGSFVFTSLYTAAVANGQPLPGTGLDLADFLLGYAQQASVQYGPGRVRFRGSSWSLFLQDDWRLSRNLTLNLGLRYEYVSPFTEANDQLVTLDVTPDFTAASPVLAGQTGPFTGPFPDSLVYGDHDNLAPRMALAWKPDSHTTIRAGYGITYDLAAYGPIAQSLAGQPPFAVSDTRIGSRDVPLQLSNAFPPVASAVTTNSFGIDKHYQLGTVQIWSLDLQREVDRIWILGIGYAGTRGSDLDLERAPNRGPEGLRIPGVQPFLWQSPDASSVMHSLTARVRRRMSHGVAFGASYVFSKALDDASSIGGGATVVAQNDQDLAAEWGRSSFDRRHRVAADYLLELPFGSGRRWLQKGLGAALLGGWMWNGTLSIQSGAPFTARVQGDFADVARGVNGTLRAEVTGEPVAVDDPTPERWFNTGAFVAPPLGAFGDVGRNTITGPSTFLVNMGLTRNVPLGGTRTLSIRVQAGNVFNTPQFTVIDTMVNSPTFGRVIATGPMRTVQIQMRFRL